MNRRDILNWLRETDPERLDDLRRRADAVRRDTVGDDVHLRGLVEFSNHCARLCGYCGLRHPNRRLVRYRMTVDDILACALRAVELGYGTVVLQSGEDGGTPSSFVVEVVRRIKTETPLAVTLSLGERTPEEMALWREAGADRYLLRFETSDPALYDRIHPGHAGTRSDRLGLLSVLRDLGYEVGSGVMVGIPGQTFESLAGDIEMFRELDLDMIGIGPFIPHPHTPLGRPDVETAGEEQAPNTETTTLKMLALTRLVCPRTNLPSTTALATVDADHGRESGLQWGANVVMPNLTPPQYRRLYEIYPAKSCLAESPETFHEELLDRIQSIGRTVGAGQGPSPNWALRRDNGDCHAS